MLYYLDNWESVAPNAFEVGPYAPGRGFFNGVPNSILPNGLQRLAHGMNENYGREIMELHTLGVNGGYTQNDVIAVARCFTGWTVRSPENPEFVFAPFMHDYGEKTVLPLNRHDRSQRQAACAFATRRNRCRTEDSRRVSRRYPCASLTPWYIRSGRAICPLLQGLPLYTVCSSETPAREKTFFMLYVVILPCVLLSGYMTR
jgi:hypothetical protein